MAYHKGKPAPNRGKPHKEETKKKISESCIKAGVGKWNLGRENIVLREYYQTHNIWNKGLRYTLSEDDGVQIKEVLA